jgi:hypothetical protein
MDDSEASEEYDSDPFF